MLSHKIFEIYFKPLFMQSLPPRQELHGQVQQIPIPQFAQPIELTSIFIGK